MKTVVLVLSLVAFVAWGAYEIYSLIKSRPHQSEDFQYKLKLWLFILYALAQLAIILANYFS